MQNQDGSFLTLICLIDKSIGMCKKLQLWLKAPDIGSIWIAEMLIKNFISKKDTQIILCLKAFFMEYPIYHHSSVECIEKLEEIRDMVYDA